MSRSLMNRVSRRTVLGATAAVVVASVAMTTQSGPALAGGNSLYFANGSDNVTVGANAAIYIDGTITFDANCQGGTRPGIDDFVYPATDVYIVQAGSATDDAGLTDAGGNGPNTIVGVSSGAFIGELIAVVYPSGSLGDGEYDVVYDTCQDGVVGPEDEIWFDAITVDVADGEIPAVDASIRRVKDAAREEYAAWLSTHMGLTALFKFEDALEIASCILAPSPGCLAEVIAMIYDVDSVMAQSSDWIEDSTLNLVMNRAKNYGAIWQDPADPAYDQLPVIATETVRPVALSGSPVADALTSIREPIAEEGALTEALLHALERYQGAQAAGDEAWALAQAQSIADLSATLAEHLRNSTEIQALRDQLAVDIDSVVDRAGDGAALINRFRSTGFTADERQALENRGFDTAAITALEARFVADGRLLAPLPEQVLAPFDELLAARAEMATALDESVAGWSALAAQLDDRTAAAVPHADAGGPYPFGDGTVTLDAQSSTTPQGTAISTVEWDLDGDGAFDDATGVNPTVTLARPRTIAVRVANDAGLAAVATAVVNGASPTALPITASPTERALTVTTGTTQAFSADVPGASQIGWTLDGAPAAQGASYVFAADADAVGEHVISVTATAGRRSIARTWVISVVAPDADDDGWTATSDCDDTRADVSPGGFERIGNGRDDDCDPATIDSPVGGVTGSVYTWGQYNSVGLFPPADKPSPVPLTTLGDQVIAVESFHGGGMAVLADGTVRAWAPGSGLLGSGQMDSSYTPVTVKNVGGTGVLNGVVEVSVDENSVLARRVDGTVVAWGQNINEQAGDGSGVDWRPAVVEVIDADTLQPVTGVVQVESGETTSFGVMSDGTVKVWGVNHCSGGLGLVKNMYATTNPLFGNDVVQVGSGDSGGAIVLTRDGSVKVCSSYTPMLGRGPGSVSNQAATTPMPAAGFGPGSGAIDVAMGSSTVTVLKDDGTVWTWGRNLNHTLDVVGLAPDHIAYTPMQVPLPAGAPVVDIETDYAATTFALRADGTVLVWGANVIYGAGVGNADYAIVGTPQINLGGGTAIAVANSMWNGLAIVKPADPAGPQADPVRPLHWIEVSVGDGSIAEATGGTVDVSLSQAAPVDVTVDYEFDGAGGSVVVPAGATTVPVTLSVVDDTFDEADEELAATITTVSGGARVADGIGLVTVVDDDDAPAVSITDATVVEGDTSLTDVALTVSLSAASDGDVVVDLATVAGTAVLGVDVQATTASVLIPAGETSVVTHVYVIGDSELEDDETFTAALSNPMGATIADGVAAVAITDDEPIVVTVTSPSVVEGDVGTTPAAFEITATQPPTPVAVTVAWSVEAGTAEDGIDVVTGSGSLTLTAGQIGVVEAAVVADDVVEPLAVETFRLVLGDLGAGSRAVVVNDIAVARIADDDVVEVSVDAGADVATTEGTPVAVTGTVTGIASPTIVWSVDQPVCTIADPAVLATSVSCTDEVTATLTLTVDGVHADTAVLTVANVAPTLTITAPADGTSVPSGAAVTLAVTTADPGVADTVSCSANWGDGTVTGCAGTHAYAAAGSYPIVVTGDDADGGVTTATVTVVVTSPTPVFDFDGFYAPVDNLPVINVVKAGATVPLKFGLGGNFGLDIFAPGFPAATGTRCRCAILDTLEQTAQPGAATLTYHPTTGRYQYNWKTSKSWAGQCVTLVLRFADGTEATAQFRFK